MSRLSCAIALTLALSACSQNVDPSAPATTPPMPKPWAVSNDTLGAGPIVLMDNKGDCRNEGTRFAYVKGGTAEDDVGCWWADTNGIIVDWKGRGGIQQFTLEDFGKTAGSAWIEDEGADPGYEDECEEADPADC